MFYRYTLCLNCSIFAFDTTMSGSSANCPQISTTDMSANYTVSCEFGGTGLGDDVQMLVFSEQEKIMSVSDENNWSISP